MKTSPNCEDTPKSPRFMVGYKWYVLTALTLLYTLSFLDQGLMMVLLQPIKEDLHLSDTQLGFLTGLAFGLLYSTLGLPVARWADRGNRATLSAVAIGLWGATVMLSVLVGSFTQLVWARIAAGAAEAGCVPPTYSLVGDYFPAPAERTRAISIYMLANSLALMLSFMIGGFLNELYGWRVTFFAVGIPGLMLAVVVKLSVREPRTRGKGAHGTPGRAPRMADVLTTLWHRRSSRHLILGLIPTYIIGSGALPWFAAFMMRSHAMGTADVGVTLGLILGLGGTVGIFLGGFLAAHWFADDETGQMRLVAIVTTAFVPCTAIFLLLPGKNEALAALVPAMVMFSFFMGPAFGLLQRLVVNEMRATTMAVVMLLGNFLGMGIGPQAVGILSDLLEPRLGNDSLRYALLLISCVAFWASYHFWQVARTAGSDLLAIPAEAPT